MCGIFGGSALPGKKLSIAKLKILGLYNIERGKHSCGYYFNGNIQKGVDKEASWDDFMEFNLLSRGELKTEIFMGHTRHSTYGKHCIDNAHPHLIDGDYVQTHNGSIENTRDLLEKHKIDIEYPILDSIGLGNLINKIGFNVLSEYIGHAALAMTWMSNPKSLFLFKGAGKIKDADEKLEDERPLFILYQPEGIYYSSLYFSLKAINEDEKYGQIFTVAQNVVTEIKNGKIVNRYPEIDRSNVNLNYKKELDKLKFEKKYEFVPSKRREERKKSIWEPIYTGIDNTGENDIIFEDSAEIPAASNGFYIRYLRYYNIKGVPLDGSVIITRNTKRIIDPVLLQKMDPEILQSAEKLWFYNGVMLKSEKEFDILNDMDAAEVDYILYFNFAKEISKYSRYPVFNLPEETPKKESELFKWYSNGIVVHNETVCPKFGNKIYEIYKGSTKSIKKKEEVFNNNVQSKSLVKAS